MTVQEFKRQIKEAGLEARKRKGLEVFDVSHQGIKLYSITFAELYPLTDISKLPSRALVMDEF